MNCLKTIKFKEISAEEANSYEIREAARALVFDDEENVGLLFVRKYNYHKLPGGGREAGEDILETLERECLEEIGCHVKVSHEVGEIVEYRDQWSLKQHSYCYIAHVIGTKGAPEFTAKELDYGFEIKWVPLSEALSLLNSDLPEGYEGQFIHERDNTFLQAAAQLING